MGRRESGRDTTSLLLATAVLDDKWLVAEVEDHHERGVWHSFDLDDGVSPITEPRHSGPCQPTRP
ncbi:hypothetical protein [Salinispora tropica]|uniref:hypothetical protein n=1 Tax=Salinispora tropica TaxID=168695 RepID=UPI001EE3B194|nr:hypothetical protein [Salinispora tropica]